MAGGDGKFRKWKLSRYKFSSSSSPSKSPAKPNPPSEFLCPIWGSLMSDPVVVSSGQTFERTSSQVCKDLGFSPTLPDGSIPDFSTIIPNLALKASILNWCRSSHLEIPTSPDYISLESAVRNLIAARQPLEHRQFAGGGDSRMRASEAELSGGPHNNYSSSSSEESVIANGVATPPQLPPSPPPKKPECCSSSSSSSSLEMITNQSSSYSSPGEDEVFVTKFKSWDVFKQEEGAILLRKTTRDDEESRATLCTARLLQAIKPLLVSRYAVIQSNSAAAIVNLSLANANKVKIVRAGLVPILIDLLKGGFEESQEHAAGGIFSLSLEDENKMAIGVLGALQPLLHSLRSRSGSTRRDSASALYHLSLISSNRAKLIKLGAVGILLGMLRGGVLVEMVVLVACNLAVSPEGRAALLDGGAVECLVGVLRGSDGSNSSESTRENCVAALIMLSQGSLRFKGLAVKAGAADALRHVAECGGSQRARENARRVLEVLRGRDEAAEIDWEGLVGGGGVSRTRYGTEF